jgi:predicted aspartyl protease
VQQAQANLRADPGGVAHRDGNDWQAHRHKNLAPRAIASRFHSHRFLCEPKPPHFPLEPEHQHAHTTHMGKVIVKLKLTNLFDLGAQHRKLSKAKPRSVEVEALVDTGATRLYLKPSVIKSLGLEKVDEVISQTTNGPKKRSVYESVRLEVQGRYGDFNVVDIGENVPNLLGQIPLEYLDFVVDSKNQKLIPNPEHGDKQMSEEY